MLDDNLLEKDEELESRDTFLEEKDDVENESGAGVLKLFKPYEINGEKISKIEYDFTEVRPIQYINLISRLSKKESIAVPELDIRVQMGYFSLASGISVPDLKRMPSTQDFTSACSRVRSFLLGTSDTENEEE